jgi:hypothetical protein
MLLFLPYSEGFVISVEVDPLSALALDILMILDGKDEL